MRRYLENIVENLDPELVATVDWEIAAGFSVIPTEILMENFGNVFRAALA